MGRNNGFLTINGACVILFRLKRGRKVAYNRSDGFLKRPAGKRGPAFLCERKAACAGRMRRHHFIQNSAELTLKGQLSDRETVDLQRGHLISHLR